MEKSKFVKISKIIFVIWLLILIFNEIYIFFNFWKYLWEILFLWKMNFYVNSLIFAIIVISLTYLLYKNIDKIKNQELEDKQNKDLLIFEEKKEKEFDEKYKIIKKIPILSSISKFLYKQWKSYSLLLISIVILAFTIRIWWIWKLWYVSDEFTINNSIKWFLENWIPSLRSWLLYFDTPLHIVLSWFLIKLFWDSETILRFPSVLFWSLIVIYPYLISKRLGFWKKIWLIISLIITIHPWFVEYSRFGKWYIMGWFFYLWAIYYFIVSLRKNKYIFLWTLFTILWIWSHKINYILIFAPFIIFLLSILNKKENKKLIIYSIMSFIVIFIWYYSFWKLNSYWFWKSGIFLKDFLNPNLDTTKDVWIFGKIKSIIPFDFSKKFDIWLVTFYKNSLPFLNLFIYLWLYITIFHLINTKSKYKKNIIFLIWILISFSFVYIYWIQLFDKLNKWYIYFSMTLIIIFFWFFLKYIFENFNKIIWLSLIWILSIILFVQSFQIINSNYWDKIYWAYSVFEWFVFRQDNKTPCEFLEKIFEKWDILISLWSPAYCKHYSNIDSEYYVMTNKHISWRNIDWKMYDLYENSELIYNYEDLIKKIILYNSIWRKVYVYHSFSMLTWNEKLAPRIWHIWWWFQDFFKENEDKKIYTWEDSITSIYLFK